MVTTLEIEGFGCGIVPRAPFEIAPRDDNLLEFIHTNGDVASRLMMFPPTDDNATLDCSAVNFKTHPAGTSWEEVVQDIDPDRNDTRAAWSIRTHEYRLEFPKLMHVWSVPPDMAWPFELAIPGCDPEEMIHLRGPFGPEQVTLAKLTSTEMTLVEQGELSIENRSIPWIENRYSLNGQMWRQRLYRVRLSSGKVLLVTAQASDLGSSRLFLLGDQVASSIRDVQAI